MNDVFLPLVPHSSKIDGKRESRGINISGDHYECDMTFYSTRSQWPLVSCVLPFCLVLAH